MDERQMQKNRIYIAIDLKSFYASVECVDRGLDPLATNLVVADASRTEKTICLAVSPSLKKYGIPGRARLFEVVQRVEEVNRERATKIKDGKFRGSSYYAPDIDENPDLGLDYIAAAPRMGRYMEVSNQIYDIYLSYVSPEDMHIYSVDEVFIDITDYLKIYNKTPHEMAMMMIRDVLHQTGITATAGIGTNLYLCKIAMDIVAKHIPADADGVRIAELDEMSYRRELWTHEPLTDFWRIGPGTAKKLKKYGMNNLGDVCRCSIGKETDFYNEDLLYKLFGVNAELLIDHAWGYEPTRIKDIKNAKPKTNSLSSGQVLSHPYDYEKTKIIIKEMSDLLALDLVKKKLVTNQIVLEIGYDVDNLLDPKRRAEYKGEIVLDRYGREVPKHSHGSINLSSKNNSSDEIVNATVELYDRIMDRKLLVRRLNITAANVVTEKKAEQTQYEQIDLFSYFGIDENGKISEEKKIEIERNKQKDEKEKSLQQAILSIKERFGANAILKATSLQEGATTIERNGTVGGHKK